MYSTFGRTVDVPVIVIGDINIHLECHDDTHSRRFTKLLASYGLQSRVHTVHRGGWLDVVATRSDLASPFVGVTDPGFSDHRLLETTVD